MGTEPVWPTVICTGCVAGPAMAAVSLLTVNVVVFALLVKEPLTPV